MYEQAAAAWLTVKDCPAIVNVALRAPPVFACTATLTEPFPVPLPPVTVIQAGTLVVVHAHPDVVVTATFVEPALAVGL